MTLEILSSIESGDRSVEHVRGPKGGEWWIVSCRCGWLEDVNTAEEASTVVAHHSCSEWLEVDRAMVREMEGS